MLIGIVSDTHGHIENTRAAVRLLESLQVAAVLHCGDIGSTEIPDLFSPWPTHFVYGNVDYDHRELSAAIQSAGLTSHGRFGEVELDGVKIAFLHGDDTDLLREAIHGGQYHMVCHGHTHVSRREKIGDTLVLNPGALYRANPHSIAVVDLPSLTVEIIVV